MSPEIKVVKICASAIIPKYAHVGSLGDLAADLCTAADEILEPGEIRLIGTGLIMEFPPNFGALVQDRSGLASKGITTLAGVIDPGYRGEISVVLANLGRERMTFRSGDRIAQLRIVQRIDATFLESVDISPTDRGTGGFGSTGR